MQFGQLKRREFIPLVVGAAALPLAARAQSSMRMVGFLSGGSRGTYGNRIIPFSKGLKEGGFVEKQNVAFEFRWADGRYDQLPALAASLVHQGVSVIVTLGDTPSAKAAKAATTTVPVVVAVGSDPIKNGLVQNLNRPQGNVTGVTFFNSALQPKRMEALRELLPYATAIAMIVNPNNPNTESDMSDMQSAAHAIGVQFVAIPVNTDHDLEITFAKLSQQAGALMVQGEPFFVARLSQLVALAARHAIPASYSDREFVTAGGLMSYGPDRNEMFHQAGIYVGKLLNGAKSSDLPVLQPTKFEFVINLKTAKALGLTVPDKLLALTDEVIE
jgi:putative ABC transport system substrate-binding protein